MCIRDRLSTYRTRREVFLGDYRKVEGIGGCLLYTSTMVKWHEAADGKWSFDYTGFDKFVAQMMSWGIGRQISGFSLVGWNTSIGYTDASGEARTLKLTVGSDEYRTVKLCRCSKCPNSSKKSSPVRL